jgi:hypothetical protein
MESYGERGGIAPTYSWPQTDWCHAPAAFYLRGKDPLPVPIGQEAGWAPKSIWTQRLEEKPFAAAVDGTPIARASSL